MACNCKKITLVVKEFMKVQALKVCNTNMSLSRFEEKWFKLFFLS